MKKVIKHGADLDAVRDAYRAVGTAGCKGDGTLVIGGATFSRWEFISRGADGTLRVEDPKGALHNITLRA